MLAILSYTQQLCAEGFRPLIKHMRRRIQAIDKTYAFLSVMTVCRNAFDNGVMAYMLQIHESTIHITFVACTVLMEAIFPCFNIKPDDWNLATSLLVQKLSHLHKTLIVRMLWLKFDWNFSDWNGINVQ